MASAKGLREWYDKNGGAAALDISGEVLEDLVQKMTRNKLKGRAGAIAFIRSLPGHQYIKFIMHLSGTTLATFLDLLPGLDKDAREVLEHVIAHVASGTGGGIADATQWAAEVDAVAGGMSKTGKNEPADDEIVAVIKPFTLVPGVHFVAKKPDGSVLMDREGRPVLRCSKANEQLALLSASIPTYRGGKGGGTSASPCEILLVRYDEARMMVADPHCPCCQADIWHEERLDAVKRDWWDQIEARARYVTRHFVTAVRGVSGIDGQEAKDLAEKLTTVKALVWREACEEMHARVRASVRARTRMRPRDVERLLALCDIVGSGEAKSTTKAAQFMRAARAWWGRSVAGHDHRWLRRSIYTVAGLAILCVLSFLAAWVLPLPQELGMGISLLGSMGSMVMLFLAVPIISPFGWLLSFIWKDGVALGARGVVFSLINFVGYFGILLFGCYLLDAPYLVRFAGAAIAITFSLIGTANSSAYLHLRRIRDLVLIPQTWIMFVGVSVVTVVMLVTAARSDHFFPEPYALTTKVVDVAYGNTLAESDVTVITTGEGTIFRVDALGPAFEHLDGKTGPARFSPYGIKPRLPGYRLDAVQESAGADIVYLAKVTPWRRFWGMSAPEFGSLDDMGRATLQVTKDGQFMFRQKPNPRDWPRSTYVTILLIAGIALFVIGLLANRQKWWRLGKVVGAILLMCSVLSLGGSAFLKYGLPEDKDERRERLLQQMENARTALVQAAAQQSEVEDTSPPEPVRNNRRHGNGGGHRKVLGSPPPISSCWDLARTQGREAAKHAGCRM